MSPCRYSVKMLGEYFRKMFTIRESKNMIESMKVTVFFKKISGLSVISQYSTDNRVVTKFSFLGLFFFLLWLSLFSYCALVGYIEDQTIVRIMYNTKLKHYGDMLERVVTLCFVFYSVLKIVFIIPFENKRYKMIFDIDNDFKNMDAFVDHTSHLIMTTITILGQTCVTVARPLSIWLTLTTLNLSLPIELIYQACFSDMVVQWIAIHHVYYIYVLKHRYQMINDMLTAIRRREPWQNTMLVRDKQPVVVHKVLSLQDKNICERIRACARIYSKLNNCVDETNRLLGFPLLLTMAICSLYIIMYLFYFMEATATGLFHDVGRYKCFLLCVFWRIAYAFAMIYVNIYICEVTIDQVSLMKSSLFHRL